MPKHSDFDLDLQIEKFPVITTNASLSLFDPCTAYNSARYGSCACRSNTDLTHGNERTEPQAC